MKLTKIEMETIILFNEEEAMAEIYTHNVKLKNKFNKFLEKYPELISKKGENTFTIPKKSLRIVPITPMSEERKEKMREIGKIGRANLEKHRRNADK